MGFPGVSSYVASKFALEGWAETLRLEMKPLGIQVVLVEPGSFETDIWKRNAILSASTQDGYFSQRCPAGQSAQAARIRQAEGKPANSCRRDRQNS